VNIPASAATGRSLAPLSFRLKLGYAAGSIVDGIMQQGTNIFLFFYATAVCGIPGGLAGTALAAGLVIDAIVDPLIGSASDGWRSRFGRRFPFMAVGLPLVALAFFLIFSLPSGLSPTLLFVWLTTLSVLLRVSTSLFLLPYNAVGAEISDDYKERSSIMAWRWGAAMIGALIAILLGFGVFFSGEGGLSHRSAYMPFALSLSLIAIVGGAIALWTVLATRDRQHPVADVIEGGMHSRLFKELREVFRNRSFRILFGGALLLFTALAIHSTLGLHANTFFWRLDAGQTQTVTLALFGGLLLGAPLAGPLLKRMEKRSVLMLGMIGLGIAYGLPATLRLLGLLPLHGAALATFLSAVVFIAGLLMATAAIAFASMMADAADEHEHLFGARREGLYFAGWAFASKAAAGAGALVAGVALQAMGFPSGEGAALPASIAPGTVTWIGIIYGPGAGLLTLLSAATCLYYRLDSTAHAAIMADLDQRRALAFAGSAAIAP
jgi:GPH family glycoside/pentoside/hexuronide:cation symporter